jgi:allantoin racemase
MTTITVINPNTSDALTRTIVTAARAAAPVGVEVRGVHPSRGVPSVESHAEEAWAALGVVEQVQAHDATSDAFVVACFGDTGVPAAREVASGPVVGMTEAALVTAALLGHHIAVVTLPPRTVVHSERVIRDLGLGHRCRVLAVEAAVGDLEEGAAGVLDAFAEQGRRAVQAGAEVLVLGCAGLAELVGPLRAALGVPVVEGVAAAVVLAAGLVTQGLSTSRVGAFGYVSGLPAVREVWS